MRREAGKQGRRVLSPRGQTCSRAGEDSAAGDDSSLMSASAGDDSSLMSASAGEHPTFQLVLWCPPEW